MSKKNKKLPKLDARVAFAATCDNCAADIYFEPMLQEVDNDRSYYAFPRRVSCPCGAEYRTSLKKLTRLIGAKVYDSE